MSRSMDKIVALCKRRGFIFQNSEIYGGQNGFWDYGPLGTELKRNVRDVWYHDMVSAHNELLQPAGGLRPFRWWDWNRPSSCIRRSGNVPATTTCSTT
ncbi:MAG UNVERIFIED_CONTAM: hypothetical protein LVR18_02390 [Planctomycetaceae bacterium]